MAHYEIVMLMHPDRSEQAEVICDRISELVSEDKGKVHRREDIGRRSLAYPIAGLQKAHYFLMNLECQPPTYDKVEEYLRFNEDILRRLSVCNKQAQTGPSALLLQTRKERERLARGAAAEGRGGPGSAEAKGTAEVKGTAEASAESAPAAGEEKAKPQAEAEEKPQATTDEKPQDG